MSIKRLTSREIELATVAALFAKRLDDSNPDVGMGPSYGMIVDRVCEMLEVVEIDPVDRSIITDLLMQWDHRSRRR